MSNKHFKEWLLGNYTLGLNYQPGINPYKHEQLTNNEMDQGRLVHLSRGFPTIHPKLEDALCGVEHSQVRQDIEVLRKSKALNGPNLVAALEYYQYEGAPIPDAHPRTIIRWRDQACDILYSMAHRRDTPQQAA